MGLKNFFEKFVKFILPFQKKAVILHRQKRNDPLRRERDSEGSFKNCLVV